MLKKLILLVLFVWAVGTAKSYPEYLDVMARGKPEAATVPEMIAAGTAAALWPASLDLSQFGLPKIELPSLENVDWLQMLCWYLGIAYLVLGVPVCRWVCGHGLKHYQKSQDPNEVVLFFLCYFFSPALIPLSAVWWLTMRKVSTPPEPAKESDSIPPSFSAVMWKLEQLEGSANVLSNIVQRLESSTNVLSHAVRQAHAVPGNPGDIPTKHISCCVCPECTRARAPYPGFVPIASGCVSSGCVSSGSIGR